MTEEKLTKVNPNIADEETLQQLPGIGRSLAQKIVASRPFSIVEDLREIRGLGKVALDRLEPYLSFADPLGIEDADLEKEEQIEDIKFVEDKQEEIEVQVLSADGRKDLKTPTAEVLFEKKERVTPKQEQPQRKEADNKVLATPARISSPDRTFSRTETLWLMVAAGLGSLILSVLVTLAIIGGINDTLDFNRLQAVKQLESELSEAKGGLEALSTSVSRLDERITPLEGLTGRVITVEDTVGAIQADVADALAGVELMQSDLEGLSQETARLSGRVDRFDGFLQGLRRVISEVFADPAEELLPQEQE